MVSYNRKMFGGALFLSGVYFIVEHLLSWGELAFFDFIGHEWLGLLLLLSGVICWTNFSKERLSKELRRSK